MDLALAPYSGPLAFVTPPQSGVIPIATEGPAVLPGLSPSRQYKANGLVGSFSVAPKNLLKAELMVAPQNTKGATRAPQENPDLAYGWLPEADPVRLNSPASLASERFGP